MKTLFAALSLLLLSSCSVYMAANKQGTKVETIAACKTRVCLLANSAVSLQANKNKAGQLTSETFKVQRPTGSIARAAMHGALDVGTLGLWEAAGTPIEASQDKSYYLVKAFYESDGNTIKRIQLVTQ